jgi:hypothetical protein
MCCQVRGALDHMQCAQAHSTAQKINCAAGEAMVARATLEMRAMWLAFDRASGLSALPRAFIAKLAL